MSLPNLIDIFEIEPPPLAPGQDLEDFLLSPAQPDVIAQHLQRESVSRRINLLLRDRKARFRLNVEGIEIEITDLRPSGEAKSISVFEERMMMFMAKGFREVSRTGLERSSEKECGRCLEIITGDRMTCPSCGSTNLQIGSVPGSVVYHCLEPAGGRSNEELLSKVWELVRAAPVR